MKKTALILILLAFALSITSLAFSKEIKSRDFSGLDKRASEFIELLKKKDYKSLQSSF